MFFTDNDIDNFIKNKMSKYSHTFYNLKYKIQRLDFFRYLAVYYYGGIYLDLDIDIKQKININFSKCVLPIEYETCTDKLLINQNNKFLIGNYAFYAPKRNSFIKEIINNINNQRIPNNLIPNSKNKYIYYTTGPVLVTQSYIDYKQKEEIDLIKPTPFRPQCFGNYGVHRAFGEWK
jgi:mannosyltransferase OCH1-like enzyme